jgi:hypothetical protein
MNAIVRAFALVIGLVCLSACTTVSTTNPIGIAAGEVSDARLLGSWKMIPPDKDTKLDNKDEAFVFVLANVTGGLRSVILFPGDHDWYEAELIAGKAGEHGMLNLRPIQKNGVPATGADKIDGYYPMRYTVGADGSIALFLWSEAAMTSAIQSSRIAGTIDNMAITLTAEPQELDDFFSAAAPDIFSMPYATLQRIPYP